MEKCTSHAQACSLMGERATYAKLWRWISPRMMALALVIVVIFEGGIWYWCEVWEQETRATLPPAVRAEISMLEAQQKKASGVGISLRLQHLYSEYLYPRYLQQDDVQHELLTWGALLGLSLVVIGVGGVWLSLRMSRQLGAVAVAAGNIAKGEFSARADIRRDAPAALKELAQDFNRMASSLERHEREFQASSAAIAHELRTPLTAAKARLQALMDGVLPATSGNYGMIMGQLDQLNRLVHDLYLLSLASAGQLELVQGEFNVRALVQERINWAAPRTVSAGMQVDLDVPDSLVVQGDRDRIGQMLTVLVDNAIRYAASGRWLGIVGQRLADGHIQLQVRDAGSGFPENCLSQVCDRFWRADGSRSRNRGGAGLGMSVAWAICAAHGGELSVSNHPDGGACVTLLLPGVRVKTPANSARARWLRPASPEQSVLSTHGFGAGVGTNESMTRSSP